MCKVNTGIVRLYIFVWQECTILICKSVHSYMIKVYILVVVDYQCFIVSVLIKSPGFLYKSRFLVYQLFSKDVFFDIFSALFLLS